MNWLAFALMTVVSWGVYGVFLHTGQMGMKDSVNGRYMAFLYVGIAYFLVAVLGPIVMLKLQGGRLDFWAYPSKGLWWSLIAGIVGAIGAFGVLLAFGAKGTPPVVMSIRPPVDGVRSNRNFTLEFFSPHWVVAS
jgi:drug/metabolite transporter (DMT)-like permease